ncbi:MAG: M23 family metallopeptidase [Holosporaceae bacterium]|jgi:murein DD-endopeptidase MepM/ murein hydrolase activator NlpD|nr:M23 family metallopeptidase [Holosporaceae bacterium]
MSNIARFFCGGVFILAGYSHVFVDFFSHRNISDIGKSSFQESALLLTQMEYPFTNGLSLTQELLQNKLSCYDAARALGTQRKKLSVAAEPNGGIATIISAPGEFARAKYARGKIRSNFYSDARNLGVPATVVDSVISSLSSRIDFKHTLKKGDAFEIIYSSKNIMLYSKIVTRRHKTAIYKFPLQGRGAYYFENGVKVAQSTKSNSFVPPLKGRLRVSSPFGNRKHPVYGRNHCHMGVDLSAPYGTPVYAVFDGVVTRASRYHRYGNCVDVRHASGYSSRYGHLSRYTVRCGARVKKNQLIGYIGTSGTSTGAHLHLELAKNKKVINPLSVKMIPDEVTIIPNMKGFNAIKRQIEKFCQQPGTI